MSARKKVLVSAYACEPGHGSEPAVGWNWALQIARFHEVWLLTRTSNRPAIESALRSEPMPGLRCLYYDLPGWARFWKRGRRGVHLYYGLWQVGAYFLVRRLLKATRFDVVHHVTFVNYWLGSLLPLLRVPFVWGPVGGGESCPRAFLRSFSWRGRMHELLRAAARWLGEHNPALRAAAARIAVGLATTPATGRRLEALACRRVEVMTQAGMSAREISQARGASGPPDGVFRVLSMGRLVHWKGFHLGLLAFAAVHRELGSSEYHLVGDGPERRRLERLAGRLGVTDSVRFWGLLPREEALKHLASCSLLLHPSLHDSGGWVCLEAMAAGRPVVCLDAGGPAMQVTPQSGFLVPPGTPGQAVSDIARILLALAADPGLQSGLGEEGRRRVAGCFDWNVKGLQMARLYEECIG